jgi:hypothetical protein
VGIRATREPPLSRLRLRQELKRSAGHYFIKINLQKEENFQRSKEVRFLTTFHHESTTISPSKTTFCTPLFTKTPAKHHSTAPIFFSRYHKKIRGRLPT